MSVLLSSDDTLSARETLNVVVLYDDRASRDHVLRIRDHLTEHFGGELEVACSWWKFDFLADSHFATAATREVQRADVIVFAVHTTELLPPIVHEWLENTLEQGEELPALLALLGSADADVNLGHVDSYLSDVAKRTGMDYLGASTVAFIPSELARKSIAHRAVAHSRVMDDILNYRPVAPSRWGINE